MVLVVSVWIRWFSVGVGGFAGSLTDPPSCVEFRSLSLSKKTKFGAHFWCVFGWCSGGFGGLSVVLVGVPLVLVGLWAA